MGKLACPLNDIPVTTVLIYERFHFHQASYAVTGSVNPIYFEGQLHGLSRDPILAEHLAPNMGYRVLVSLLNNIPCIIRNFPFSPG